jgi:hypothetical protein
MVPEICARGGTVCSAMRTPTGFTKAFDLY